jgi:hypothetical protein
VFGSTSVRGTGTYRFSLPTPGVAENYQPIGQVVVRDEGPGSTFFGTVLFNAGLTDRMELWMHSQSATIVEGTHDSADTPMLFQQTIRFLSTSNTNRCQVRSDDIWQLTFLIHQA